MSETTAEWSTVALVIYWFIALLVYVLDGWHDWCYRFLIVAIPLTILWYRNAYPVIKKGLK